MSIPLGLKPVDESKYVGFITTKTHDFAIAIDIVRLDHTPIRSVTDTTLDGQINVQGGEAVARTATFTFDDPDHSLHLDADSPWEGAVFADRMIRVRHSVTVPGLGTVTSTPFVGPITKVSRNGDTLDVECQDKACLALTGGPPIKVTKGADAVNAIRKIMRDGAGENRFRLPEGVKRNLHKPYATGWTADASPWVVCSRIADQINMQMLYSADGYLTLRRLPSRSTISVAGTAITSMPQVDFDSTAISNIVRVAGKLAPPRQPNRTRRANAKPQLETPPTTLTAVAVAAPSHPLSPSKLGRNGVPRYLPTIISDATYKSLAQARDLATSTLQRDLLLTTGVSFDMVPVFHLDVGDLIEAQTPAGRVVVRFSTASIPLGIGGDMSVGTQRRISRGHGTRTRGAVTHHHATKAQRKAYRSAMAAWRKQHHGGRHG